MKSNCSTALSPAISCKRLFRPHIAAIMILVISLVCSTTLIWRSEQRRFEFERARVSDLAGDHAHLLQAGIERALSATFSLAALVREGKGDISNFEATAREMLPFFPGVAALQLAPGGVVRQIVPLAGNEAAIGHDLFKDPVRRNEAIKTRDAGKLTLAGPFSLKQGGFGAVGRMPVYLGSGTGGRTFWGFTNVLIRFPDVLEPAHLADLEKRGFRYELWRLHPDTGKRQIIAASSSAPPIKPVDRSLELPNGTWTLSVAPSAGWSDSGGLAIKGTLGLVFSLLLCFLTYSLLGTRAKALQIAQELTSELRESEEKFRVIFDQSFQFIGIMTVYGTLTEANRSALELSGIKESEAIGKPFWETPWWTHSPEMQEKLRAAVEKAAKGEFVRFEATHPAIDGSLHYVDFSLKPVMDKDGNVVLLIPEGRDITDRRQAEEEIRKLNQELEQRVKERTAQLEAANRELEAFSYQDGLTGVFNRRHFDRQLEYEWRRCGRSGSQLSLIMVDVDCFKLYNDNYGHLQGDECLKRVAACIAGNARRAEDMVARYGGEEFVVLLPDTDINVAHAVAESIRSAVEALNLPHPASFAAKSVTISLGVAGDIPIIRGNPHDLVSTADCALYNSKSAGRNRVSVEFPSSEGSLPQRDFDGQ